MLFDNSINLLLYKFKFDKLIKLPIVYGILINLLLFKFKPCKLIKLPIVSGIVIN